MTDSERKDITGTHENQERKRRPYQKPTFECERVFETMALVCGKTSPTQQQCFQQPKNS